MNMTMKEWARLAADRAARGIGRAMEAPAPVKRPTRPNTAGPARWNAAALTLYLPIRTKSEGNQREHWRYVARRKAAQRTAVGLAITTLIPMVVYQPIAGPRARPITLRRIAPTALDSDNLAASFKAIRDEVAAQFGVDDRHPDYDWRCEQRKGRPGEYAVEIELRRRERRADK